MTRLLGLGGTMGRLRSTGRRPPIARSLPPRISPTPAAEDDVEEEAEVYGDAAGFNDANYSSDGGGDLAGEGEQASDEEQRVENATDAARLISRLIEEGPDEFGSDDHLMPSVETDQPGISEEEIAEILRDQEEEEEEEAEELDLSTIGGSVSTPQSLDSDAMPPPPSRRPSMPEDTSEAIPHKRDVYPMQDFEFALALWCIHHTVSRRQYSSLLQILQILTSLSDIAKLPKDVGTLKNRCTAQLPLLSQRRKKVDLIPEKLPSVAQSAKFDFGNAPPQAWVYWFDPICLISAILSSPSLSKGMKFGMAEFVDTPSEFYHSDSWATSIRSTSGEYARYSDGSPIFPSDFVEYKCSLPGCDCTGTSNKTHKGRVWSVGKNHTFSAPVQGGITLVVQALMTAAQAKREFEVSNLATPLEDNEIILKEDGYSLVQEIDILGRLSYVTMDYNFETGIRGSRPRPFSQNRIRRVANSGDGKIRPACLSNPPRAELELKQYGSAHFISLDKKCISVPMLCFVDGFGLYRNMYRSLMGVYLTIASMDLRQRSRRANMFPLTLGPHGSDFGEVYSSVTGLRDLEKGMEIEIRGEKKLVCAYTLAYTGDMPQQQHNAGFMRQSATRGCRSCLITEKQRGDLDYDIIQHGRYVHHQNQLREHSSTLGITKRKAHNKEWGFAEPLTSLVKISPALDIINSRPHDPAHSEFAGMSKQEQLLLVEAILTKSAKNQYAAELRQFPFPPGWGRLQSPIHHLKSWRMQEAGRGAIITPFLLRSWLRPEHIKPAFLKAVEAVFEVDSSEAAVNEIVSSYGSFAKSTSTVLSSAVRTEDIPNLQAIIIYGRKRYQKLCDAASMSRTKHPKSGLPRSVSPAPSAASSASEMSNMSGAEPDVDEEDAPMAEFDAPVEPEPEPTKKGKRGKAAEYLAFKSRPNVHAGLHLASLAREYGTPNNVNVLQGEDKHRLYKRLAQTSNGRGVEKMLLSYENISQTIRLLVAGASLDDSDLTAGVLETMNRLQISCPILLDGFLPSGEQIGAFEADESEEAINGDKNHIQPAVSKSISRAALKNAGLPFLGKDLQDLKDPICLKMRGAYAREYQKPNVIELGSTTLKWYQRFSFTDPTTEHRITFTAGDFVKISGYAQEVVRVDAVFVHEMQPGKKTLFLLLTDTILLEGLDEILQVPRRRLSTQWRVVGLPAVKTVKIWLVKKSGREKFALGNSAFTSQLRRDKAVGDADGVSDSHFQTELLECPWEIKFM